MYLFKTKLYCYNFLFFLSLYNQIFICTVSRFHELDQHNVAHEMERNVVLFFFPHIKNITVVPLYFDSPKRNSVQPIPLRSKLGPPVCNLISVYITFFCEGPRCLTEKIHIMKSKQQSNYVLKKNIPNCEHFAELWL